MTERLILNDLINMWGESGVYIHGTRHFLVAWQIMFPTWRINDERRHWNEPSLDFLVADEAMHLTVIELKTEIKGIKPGWQVLCQVTHRAAMLSRSFSPEHLNDAFLACWRDSHGLGGHIASLALPPICQSLTDYYQHFFTKASVTPEAPSRIGRCVAARRFSDSWSSVLSEFNTLSGDALRYRVRNQLSSKSAHRELDRFEKLEPTDWLAMDGPVFGMCV